jgi:glycosyltransferase involved in cell wall biosynthesis
VLDVGSSAARKNVEGLVEAGLQLVAARRDVRLIWKVRDLQADPNAAARLRQAAAAFPDQIGLLEGDWARADILGFLDQIDLLASFSRAEGFGLPIAEAMRRGVAVAAPIWGGPADFCDQRSAVPLPFAMTPVRDPSHLYAASQGEWADVDVEQAVAILSGALEDRPRLAVIAEEARRRSRDLFGVDRFMGQLGLERA